MRHLTEDTCRDLLGDLLSPAERRAALAHAAECPTCEDVLRACAGERERMRIRGYALGVIEPRSATDPESRKVARPRPPAERPSTGQEMIDRLWGLVPTLRWGFAAGAVAVAALVLVLILPTDRAPYSDLSRPLLPYQEEITLRGQPGPAGDALLQGLDAYTAGDLTTATDHLDSARADGPAELVRRIYLGSALLRQAEYARALEVLESVNLEQVPEPWRRETRWNLYLALRGSGRDPEADALLDTLTEGPGALGQRALDHQESIRR